MAQPSSHTCKPWLVADQPIPVEQLPEVRAAVMTITWDWENKTWDLCHEGLNHYEALGMLIRATDWMRGQRYK